MGNAGAEGLKAGQGAGNAHHAEAGLAAFGSKLKHQLNLVTGLNFQVTGDRLAEHDGG